MEDGHRYYGKYRGLVVNNIDPLQTARLFVQVSDVLGSDSPGVWAMPCVPMAGLQTGMFLVPPLQAGVWVEFEQGNPEYPVWTGFFWNQSSDIPSMAQTLPPGLAGFALQTTLQNALVVSDLPGPTGGIMLKSATGASLIVNDTGIYIQNGQGASVTLVGPTVTVNSGALVVT